MVHILSPVSYPGWAIDPHAILAVYTDKLAEASVANATLGTLEDAVLDAEMDAVVAKYAVEGFRPVPAPSADAVATPAPIVSSAAPVHVPSNAGEDFESCFVFVSLTLTEGK